MEARNELRDRLARVAVEYGANLQPGQVVNVNAEHGQHELARAIAAHAYRRGARFVDVWYFDPHVKRARIEHAAENTLDYVPPWYGQRALGVGELRGSLISIAGATTPGLLGDLDAARVGRDLLSRVKENFEVINRNASTWLVIPGPVEGWARQVYPDADDPLERLWEQIAHVCRLDTDDPVAAWRERFGQTGDVGRRLMELELDAVHFEGQGTDLTVGLLPTSKWRNANETTVDGVDFVPNLPSEELTSTPDPQRADGVVRSTRPLVFSDGTLIDGIRVRFEGGYAVELDAEVGGEALRGRTSIDEGARRLGEVALVDREGRIGPLGTIFYNTLLDENAASHLALGGAYESLVGAEDLDRIDQRARPLSGTYTYSNTGSGVKAYIIDTGIRLTHNDFGGRAITGFDAVTSGGSASDCNGHGTHVAGTVGGLTYGVAKGATLVAVRVLNCAGSGTWSQVIAGIDWVTGNHAGESAVANMSPAAAPTARSTRQ